MSTGSDTSWVGKKPLRRVGGMSDALSIASDLGFHVSLPPSQEELQNSVSATSEKDDDLVRVLRELTAVQRKIADLEVELRGRKEELQNSVSATSEKDDDLVRVLREFTAVQRKIADLEVELRGRKDDKNVAHLTHVTEMEKKCETLARITTVLKDVIQNKDCIIARLQQPYSLDCIPVEAEFQKQFSELLMKAARDYGALTASVSDFQWTQNFKEPPSVWAEMLRPIPVALASCTRFFEAMSAMRESFATLQNLRVGHSTPLSSLSSTPASARDPSRRILGGDSDCVTPPAWRNEQSSFDDLTLRSSRKLEAEQQQQGGNEYPEGLEGYGGIHRRLSWPPHVNKNDMQ